MSKDGSNKAPMLRNTYLLFAIVALMGAFIALNYLVFIPRQQTAFNKKAFRIMHKESEDFGTQVKAYADYFQKSHGAQSNKANKKMADSSRRVNQDGSVAGSLKNAITLHNIPEPSKDTCIIYFGTDSVVFHYVPKDSLAYDSAFTRSHAPAKGDQVKSIDDFIQPIQAMHQQMFDYILLIKKGPNINPDSKRKWSEKLLYKSPGLALDNYILIDSLMKREALQFATIHDMEVEGARYKLFLMPFTLNNQSFYLAGFIEQQGYKLSVTSSSSWAFLLIVSLLAAIIIGLPILKLFLLGKQENIVISDIRMLMVSLSVAPVFFILILLTVKTYSTMDHTSSRMLTSLHEQVRNNFINELQTMVVQLKLYDSLIHLDVSIAGNEKRKVDSVLRPTKYKIFDNLSWTDNTGMQIAKWSLLKKDSFYFLNLAERKYYKEIKNGKGYVLLEDSLSVQPILSWSSGEYSINVATPSHEPFNLNDGGKKEAILVTLGSSMYSVVNPVVPRAYNFCIVDNSGSMLFHSESNRALHENLFDECDNNDEVMDAIAHKDSVLIQTVGIYGRDVKMLITPIKGLPYYLVSYYNKREQNFYVYHLTAFSLLCVSAVLLIMLFFLYGYYLGGRRLSPLLFSPGESDWMKPSPGKIIYYKRLYVYLVLLALLILISSFIIFEFCYAHWLILDMAVLSCFLAVTGYYIIKASHLNEIAIKETEKKYSGTSEFKHIRILTFFFVVLFLLSLVIVFYTETWLWAVIPWIFSAIVLYAAFRISGVEDFRFLKNDYINLYVRAVFLSIVLISVLPTFIFFKYSFDHEKFLQVKSRQIYLAEKIAERNLRIDDAFKATKLFKNSNKEDSIYLEHIKYSTGYGIYTAFSNVHHTTYPKDTDNNTGVDSFYKVVTKLLFLPADHTDFFTNSAYHTWPYKWGGDSVRFYYKEINNGNNQLNAINVNTTMSELKFDLFDGLFTSFIGWLILMVFILFLLLHYRTIKSLSRRIFLSDFPEREVSDDCDITWINNILMKTSLNAGDEKALRADGTFNDDSEVVISYYSLQDYEDKQMKAKRYVNILRMQHILTPAYDEMWGMCPDKERFILYDFALDGFTNYKNPDILYTLFKKGLLRVDTKNGGLLLMAYSFRNYLISKSDSDEILKLKKNINKGGTWKLIQNVFFVVMLMVFAYLVITQQEVSTRIAAIISGLVSLLPALIKLFDRRADGGDNKS